MHVPFLERQLRFGLYHATEAGLTRISRSAIRSGACVTILYPGSYIIPTLGTYTIWLNITTVFSSTEPNADQANPRRLSSLSAFVEYPH